MALPEIVLPETKPETEWVSGRALQKMSPTRTHGRLQLLFGAALDAWAAGRGDVATEWRFRVAPPGEARRPLVPDIAYVDHRALHACAPKDREVPALAPTVAVEIRSAGDREIDIAEKIRVYLLAGTSLVIVVDPRTRSARLCDRTGTRTLSHADVLQHDALPGFALALDRLFANALD